MGGTAEGPRPPGRVLNRVFLGILWTHLGLCGLLLPASPDIWEAVRPLRDAGPRSALLRGPLCEAHCRDFHPCGLTIGVMGTSGEHVNMVAVDPAGMVHI